MRSRIDRERDRASFLTPPYEQTNVLLAQAIRELCSTIDDAAELVALALKATRIDSEGRSANDAIINDVMRRAFRGDPR